MTSNETSDPNAARWPGGKDVFATTHWSVVLAAGRAEPELAHQALSSLCQTYWYPLYAFARRRGFASHDAEDLTQSFFAHLLEKNALAAARRDRGKFRSYLLASLNHFMADEWDRAQAQKRGAGRVVSLDTTLAEDRLRGEQVQAVDPEKAFHRNWAMTVLETVYARLRQQFEADGKQELFNALKFSLTGERSRLPYADLAVRLQMSEAAVKVAVHRLRERYRALLRAEIAHTVASADEVEDELRFLMQALAG